MRAPAAGGRARDIGIRRPAQGALVAQQRPAGPTPGGPRLRSQRPNAISARDDSRHFDTFSLGRFKY